MADAKGYITAGEYPGDGLAEVFLELGQQDPTLSGCLDAFDQREALGSFTLEEADPDARRGLFRGGGAGGADRADREGGV